MYMYICVLTFWMKTKKYINLNFPIYETLYLYQWVSWNKIPSPSQPFWSSKTTTCTPIPPSQQSGDHLTSESVISHHVCHIKISHGETSFESKSTRHRKLCRFWQLCIFWRAVQEKSALYFLVFFFFSVMWCTLALDHLGASTGSLITYKCLHITEY